MILAPESLSELSAEQMREMLGRLMGDLEHARGDLRHKQAIIDKLTHENAVLKRLKFAAQSERFSPEQRSLLEESLDADLQAVAEELQALVPPTPERQAKQQPKRRPLPAHLPRREIRHDPESTTCACGCQMKRIGEDVSEKLDYVPGTFTVERHIRGKWACVRCETIVQAPVEPHVIDKGIPSAGLVAHVMVAKYADHQPLYRLEPIFGRAGFPIPRSTLAQWVGTCGVRLQPLFEALKAVVYDFCESRAGVHAREFLGDWQGTLVCDDYCGYKEGFKSGQIVEAGCLAHARRKFFDLHVANKSQIAEFALEEFGKIYEIERQVKDLETEARKSIRQQQIKPVLDALHEWMTLQRQKVPGNSATAKALDYSLNRWTALTRFVDDGQLPVDNNWVENRIRPIAQGRANWLFAGSLRAGMNGHDPYAYLKDILTRLPTHKASQIEELLAHRWKPAGGTCA